MSGHTARARAGNDRASLYTEITDKIIAELKAGRIPWVQPWGTAAIKAPRRRVARHGERGTTVVYADRFTPDDERRRAAEAGVRRQG